MNMFDTGMFGMLHPNERKRIMQGGSLYQRTDLSTAGGATDQTQTQTKDEPWHKGFFWNKGKRQQTDTAPSFTDLGELGTTTGQDIGKGGAILPSSDKYAGATGTVDAAKSTVPFHPSFSNKDGSTFSTKDISQDKINWFSKLVGLGKQSSKEFKESGGFDKMMSNPAFTLGLALMQSSAQGKSIGSGVLDNFVKAAGISEHFKDRLEAKVQEPIEATQGQIDSVKATLETMDVKAPNVWEAGIKKIFTGKNVKALYDEAAESIANAVELKVNKIKLAHRKSGSTEPLVINQEFRRNIIQGLIDKGSFKKVRGTWFFTAGTIEAPHVPLKNKAEGGPVAAGEPYVVGEGGPEYFLPQESGKILSNDDSRIFAMLLSANPQLQNVSKTRAEKILRNRFPEYFE